jgi:DNA-binding IclR family transcriptional regulator
MPQVPAATRALAVLTHLASAPGPQPAGAISRALGLPRSSTYHLLDAMRAAGFVVHIPTDERWGLGIAAFEVGAAFTRHDPLERLAAPLLQALAKQIAPTAAVAYLAVLHATETLYLAKAETRHLPIVTEVGVRLPAALTASGRAMLAALPIEQVRADFSTRRAWVDRTGLGPTTWSALRVLLDEERERGWSEEDGHISEGFASVAAPVRGHLHRPVAAIGVTFSAVDVDAPARRALANRVLKSANELSRRIGER